MLVSLREFIRPSLGFYYPHCTIRAMGSCHWQCSQMAQSSIYSPIRFGIIGYRNGLRIYTRAKNKFNTLASYSDGGCSSFRYHSGSFTWWSFVFTLRTIITAWQTLWNREKAIIKKESNRNTRPTPYTKVARREPGAEETAMIYVVSYLLNPKRDASALLAELQYPSVGWCHYLDDTWLIATNETADALYNRLAKHLLNTDMILIIEFKPNASYRGFLPKDAWDWIEQHKYH